MTNFLTPGRASLAGVAVLMVCACGAATEGAVLVTAGGLPATTTMVHPIFVAVAGVLIVYGLWSRRPLAGKTAVGAFVLLALGAALTPPSVMTASAIPWSPVQLGGAGLYLLAALALGYAFWRAFPSPNREASVAAMGGVALATGCGCCMVTGAVAGIATTAGASVSYIQPGTVLFWSGMSLAAAGVYALGGWRALVWVPVGAAVIRFGPDLLRAAGDLMVAGANLRAFGAYLVTIAGAGVVMHAFAVAYRRAEAVAAASAHGASPEVPAAGTAPGG